MTEKLIGAALVRATRENKLGQNLKNVAVETAEQINNPAQEQLEQSEDKETAESKINLSEQSLMEALPELPSKGFIKDDYFMDLEKALRKNNFTIEELIKINNKLVELSEICAANAEKLNLQNR